MKTLYFNQWFSSIANVIDDIKKNNDVRVVASSKTPEHAYRYSVDTFIVEDWICADNKEESMQNYVDWVLNLCTRECVDMFFVKKYAPFVMAQAHRFEALGVILISENYNVLMNMESKAYVYDKLKTSSSLRQYIPDYHVFNSIFNATSYVNQHRGLNDICLKFDRDEGGISFRAIKDIELSLDSLYSYGVNTLTTDEACSIIKSAGDDIGRLIFMEMLDSPEISIDCYNSKNGFIAMARMKVSGRKQKLFYHKELAEICKQIGNVLDLKFPYNVQFRVKHGGNSDDMNDLRLLEINPRLSGGLYYEVLCGKNIAEVCMRDKFGYEDSYDIAEFIGFEDQYVTYVEKALIIKD